MANVPLALAIWYETGLSFVISRKLVKYDIVRQQNYGESIIYGVPVVQTPNPSTRFAMTTRMSWMI
jgi:hypothetical protein